MVRAHCALRSLSQWMTGSHGQTRSRLQHEAYAASRLPHITLLGQKVREKPVILFAIMLISPGSNSLALKHSVLGTRGSCFKSFGEANCAKCMQGWPPLYADPHTAWPELTGTCTVIYGSILLGHQCDHHLDVQPQISSVGCLTERLNGPPGSDCICTGLRWFPHRGQWQEITWPDIQQRANIVHR